MKKVALFFVFLLVGCGGEKRPSRFPERLPGCDVEILHDAPTKPTVNIGAVTASCDEGGRDEDCLRTLKDEVCKLGGDMVWGVEDKPVAEGSKKTWHGRAVHTKPPKARP